MKLLTLNLKAVGPFTDVVLDFSQGAQGLHLIFGKNEAGKTSTLRALSHLLFGFPQRSADNFIHPNDQLRIGGTLRHSNGEELEVIRRRGNRNTLRRSDDSSVVDDELLARFLGGMNQETFETLFGIDHERLTRAGEEIRTGAGHLGEMLFAAGAGLAGLSQAQKTLADDLDAIFRPRGQNPRINKTLSELGTAQRELKSCLLSSDVWQQHDRAFADAMRAAEQIRDQVRRDRGAQASLKRIKSAIPLLGRRRQLDLELEQLGSVIRLRDDFGSEFREAHDQFRDAELTITRSRKAIEEIDARLEPLDPPRALLDAATEIESLQERLGAVEKASQDRVRLENFLQDVEHQARGILRDLDRKLDLDEAETLRLRVDEPLMIRGLGQRYAQLHSQADHAQKTIDRHQEQIKRHQVELSSLAQTFDVEPLRRAVSEARKAGDIDGRLAETRGKLARVLKKAETALGRLPGWNRTAVELERLAVPLSSTVDQFETLSQDLARQAASLAGRITGEDDSISQIESRLKSLELERDVPTEEVLVASRRRREEGWQLVKAAWLDHAIAGESDAQFIAEFAPQASLSLAYEQSVEKSDSIADRLRREADRVAQKAESLAQLAMHQTTRRKLIGEHRELEDREATIKRKWNLLIGPLGIAIELQGPAELREWLRQREETVQLLEKAEEIRQSLDPMEQTFHARFVELSQILNEIGEPLSGSRLDLAKALEHAEAVVTRHDVLLRQRAKLETKLTAARDELNTAELSLRTAETELTTWRSEWSLMMTKIGLESEATPEQAEAFLNKIGELLAKLDERRSHQSRIRGIDRDADEFARDVTDVAASAAPELANQPVRETTRELAQRLRAAQSDAQQSAALTAVRKREEETLHLAETQSQAAGIRLERLCKEARCSHFDELPEAERRSQSLCRLEAARATFEEQILDAAAGAELAEFCQRVEQADPNELDRSIEELDTKIASQEEELSRLDQTIGGERGELERMDGSARAANIAEEAQTLLARLSGDVSRFATLKLAATVMNRAIERYREKNQGPILARAGALFASLTDDSFARLQIDDDGEGRSVLKGCRPNGHLVAVEGMSDGSHDQLYLALRLASLESWLQSHEPVPFVVDDILLNFDNLRATRALLALAELSRRTQVLFFTHHHHIIELACSHLAREVVFVHELPRYGDVSSENGGPLGQKAAK